MRSHFTRCLVQMMWDKIGPTQCIMKCLQDPNSDLVSFNYLTNLTWPNDLPTQQLDSLLKVASITLVSQGVPFALVLSNMLLVDLGVWSL